MIQCRKRVSQLVVPRVDFKILPLYLRASCERFLFDGRERMFCNAWNMECMMIFAKFSEIKIWNSKFQFQNSKSSNFRICFWMMKRKCCQCCVHVEADTKHDGGSTRSSQDFNIILSKDSMGSTAG